MLSLLFRRAVADVALVGGIEGMAAQRMELLALVELAADPLAQLLVDQPREDEVRLDQPPVSWRARASGLRRELDSSRERSWWW